MVTLDGQKIRLAEGRSNRKFAEQQFHAIKAVQPRQAEDANARIADVMDRFLSWSRIHRSPETNRNRVWSGQKFCEHAGYPRGNARREYDADWKGEVPIILSENVLDEFRP